MVGAALHDIDLVAIRADGEPCDGKVVIARLDNEVMLKRYRRIDDGAREAGGCSP